MPFPHDPYYILEVDDFLGCFPEFVSSKISNMAVKCELENAEDVWDRRILHRFYRRVCFLWTAHQLATRFELDDPQNTADYGTTSSGAATTGTVTDMEVSPGRMKEKRAMPGSVTSEDPSEAYLASTRYGLQLLALLEYVAPKAIVCTPPDRRWAFSAGTYFGRFGVGY